MSKNKGFTLIEVLLSLVIISIAYLALLSALSSSVFNTRHIENKSYAQWVALNAINSIKLNLVELHSSGEIIREKTRFLDKTHYWNAHLLKTSIPHVEKIEIEVSTSPSGPFYKELSGFRYAHEKK